MSNIYKIIFVLFLISSCKEKQEKNETSDKDLINLSFDENSYVTNLNFAIGDVRRYGLTASTVLKIHPKTNKTFLETILDIAEESKIEMVFAPEFYKTNLKLNERKNIKLKFNDSKFNSLRLIKRDSINFPENIKLSGKLSVYGNLGITGAENIVIDSIILISDKQKNLWGKRNTGAHFYLGCENIKLKYIEVQDLGSGESHYKNAHAAIVIDGAGNNPKNICIDKAHVKSTDRHGVYITGTDNYIKELIIDKFGEGDSNFMSGMQDAVKGEEKEFTGLWINKCYDCAFDKVTINEKESKGKYTAFFDAGDKTKPTLIGEMIILNDNKAIGIKRDDNTAVEASVSIKK